MAQNLQKGYYSTYFWGKTYRKSIVLHIWGKTYKKAILLHTFWGTGTALKPEPQPSKRPPSAALD